MHVALVDGYIITKLAVRNIAVVRLKLLGIHFPLVVTFHKEGSRER
jgi:hypothetical protein